MRHWFKSHSFADCLLCGIFLAQVNVALDVNAQENSQPKPAQRAALTPPALPKFKPPIEYFRELLAMPVVERERSIADRSDEQKKMLRAKLNEYELMTPEERELRLAVTELRFYLVPLMKTERTQRAERLKDVPADKRYLIKDRLQRWDKLSSHQQQEFLESEMTVNYFLRLRASNPEQQTNLLQTFSAEYRRKLEREVERWNSLPVDDRNRMSNRFQEFFELNPAEKEKTLGTLSQAERAQMERTLLSFQNLSVDQRRHCIESFDKLARLNERERIQFLQKAEAWKKMSPTDRDAWRELVHKLPQMPPLPPGLKVTSPRPPNPSSAINFP